MPAQHGIRKRTFGPVAMNSAGVATIYHNTSQLIYDVVKKIHIVNNSGSVVTFSLYVDQVNNGNAPGKELVKDATIEPGGVWEWYGNLRLEYTDYLTGRSNGTNPLSITGEGKQFVTGFPTTTTTIPPTEEPTTEAPTIADIIVAKSPVAIRILQVL